VAVPLGFQTCVARLTDEESSSTATIKMQVFFGREYQSYGDVTRQYAERLNASLRELELEIVEASAGSRDECELLYRKMVSAILVRSNVGSPTDITVVREATAALESVLPPIELGTFAALTTRAKETQLVELASIVTGIRLFNKSCGKGALLLSRDSRATLPRLARYSPATRALLSRDSRATLPRLARYSPAAPAHNVRLHTLNVAYFIHPAANHIRGCSFAMVPYQCAWCVCGACVRGAWCVVWCGVQDSKRGS
jgi:hypothetical protein